jgi:hypothetical protein
MRAYIARLLGDVLIDPRPRFTRETRNQYRDYRHRALLASTSMAGEGVDGSARAGDVGR